MVYFFINMVTFILPGYSVHNKSWAQTTAKELKLDDEIRPISWSHWDDPGQEFDPKEKVRLIVDTARGNQINIIAKSLGTLVASYIIERAPDKIERVVLCGIPLNDLDEGDKEVYKRVLSSFPAEKIICYQNANDPHGSFQEAEKFLTKIKPDIKVISKERDDHEYPYYDDFTEFLLRGTVG